MQDFIKDLKAEILEAAYEDRAGRSAIGVKSIMNIIDSLCQGRLWQHKEQQKDDWIPCSERMPAVETEVLILAKRKYRDGGHKYIVTTALYEDGTVRENNSCWYWEDIDGEWDEEEDCLIIPEGWWEYRHFNADGVYNNAVDSEVIGWQPLPEKPEE